MGGEGKKRPLFQDDLGLSLRGKTPRIGDVALHIVGEEDREALICGRLIRRAAARVGLEALSEFVPGEESGRGGALFKLKVSDASLFWLGDSPDVLIDLRPQVPVGDGPPLPPGAALIYDCGVATVDPGRFPGVAIYPVPMVRICKTEVGSVAARAMVALGAAAKLLRLSWEPLETLLREGTSVKGISAEAAIRAIRAGSRYAAEFLVKSDPHFFPLAPRERPCLLLSGGEARRLGALASGCSLFFMDRNAVRSPDETADEQRPFPEGRISPFNPFSVESLAQILGVYLSGAKAMVETSGSGLEMIQGFIGGSRRKIPMVIVDVQKKTFHSEGVFTQSDLNSAVLTGHAENGAMVLAPSDIDDCFHLSAWAFRLAEQIGAPIIILSDETLSQRTVGAVRRPDGSPRVDRREERPKAEPFQRAAQNPFSLLLPGLDGRPLLEDRFVPVAWEGESPAEVGFISWGVTQPIVREAMRYFREIGFPAAALYPKMLWPPPQKALKDFSAMVKKVVVVEGNKEGHFARIIQTFTSIRPIVMTPSKKSPLTPADLLEKEDWR